MSEVPDTNTVIKVAKISQYLYNRAIASSNFYGNQKIDKRRPRLLNIVRKDVEWMFNRNPSDPSLAKTGAYLFGLCAPYTQQALVIINNATIPIPIVTGPSNQSVLVGATATFNISVASSLTYTIQWYRNGVLIPGAIGLSYSLSNCQLSFSGDTFYARITDSAGRTVQSQTGVLTVNAQITGKFSYGDVDPDSALQSHSDPFTYQTTFNIIHNADIEFTMPSASSPNKYLIVRVPDTETVKNNWYNDPFNNGTFNDFNWQASLQFGGFTYYYSRQALSLNTNSTLKLS